jgi:hypothetical protein
VKSQSNASKQEGILHPMMTLNLRQIPKAAVFLSVVLCTMWVSGQARSAPSRDISGMYTFLQDGEFVQINVEAASSTTAPAAAKAASQVRGRPVTGFVSRFGDLDSDKGAFLDHFFAKGSLDGNELSFTTKVVHGVSFEFKGKVERGTAKAPAEEGYYVIKGTLKRNSVDANSKKTSSQSREVVLKSFPDLDTDS